MKKEGFTFERTENSKFKALVFGHPTQDVTLCLLPGKELQPKEINIPGLAPFTGYIGEYDAPLWERGKLQHHPTDEIADDFNPCNPFQKIKIVSCENYTWREFAAASASTCVYIEKLIFQTHIKNQFKDVIFRQHLYIGSTYKNNKIHTNMDFPWMNLSIHPKLFDQSRSLLELNLLVTPNTFLELPVPAGSEFSMTFVFKCCKNFPNPLKS